MRQRLRKSGSVGATCLRKWSTALSAVLFWTYALAIAPTAAAADEAGVPAKQAASKPSASAGGHADEHGGHAHHTLHGEEPKGLLGKGTEFLYISPQLFIWTLLIFLPCVFIMKKLAWAPLLQSLDDREHKIKESLRLAEQAKLEAEQLAAEHNAFKATAFASIRETIDRLKADAEQEGERILSEARESAAKELETAKSEIESARVEALGQLRSSSAMLAASIAGKLVDRKFDPSSFEAAIAEGSS